MILPAMPTDKELQSLFEYFKQFIVEVFTEGPEDANEDLPDRLTADRALFATYECLRSLEHAILHRRDNPDWVNLNLSEVICWGLIARLLAAREEKEINNIIQEALKPRE